MPQTTVTSATPDSSSQNYINNMRNQAQQGAGLLNAYNGNFFLGPQSMSIGQQVQPFMNPFMSNVIDQLNPMYDKIRAQAGMGINDAATAAGAFGGSRHALERGARLGEIDAAQGQQTASILHQGYNQALQQALPYWQRQHSLAQQQAMEPIWRQQQALGLLQQGMGPMGQQTTSTVSGMMDRPNQFLQLGNRTVMVDPNTGQIMNTYGHSDPNKLTKGIGIGMAGLGVLGHLFPGGGAIGKILGGLGGLGKGILGFGGN